MVPEIWSARDNFFFFWILDHFLPFYLYDNLKNQNFEKAKKILGDTHCSCNTTYDRCFILGYFLLFYPHVYHKWPYDMIWYHMITYMMYGSWDLERDRQKLWSFWTIFCPTTSLITWKIKILKKWKNARWYHLHIHTKNYDHIMYSSWDMVHNGWVDRIDGQTDRKSDIQRWVPHLKII